MPKPYSSDLRERVLAQIKAGETVRAVGAVFMVAPSTIVRWTKSVRETGSLAPGKIGGHIKPKLASQRDWLLDRVGQDAKVTLRTLMAELAERGVDVSYGTVWNFLHREKLRSKKKPTLKRVDQHRLDSSLSQ